jgi:hypothetical protein
MVSVIRKPRVKAKPAAERESTEHRCNSKSVLLSISCSQAFAELLEQKLAEAQVENPKKSRSAVVVDACSIAWNDVSIRSHKPGRPVN